MPRFDLSLDELWARRIDTPEPDGLDDWWATRLAEARDLAKPPTLTPYRPDAYGPLAVYDVEFSGARGDRIRGWYLRPPGAGGARLPVVVTFIGYGGGRGMPTDHTTLAAAGFANFVMDTREQGGRWTVGATEPQNSMVMTEGITDPLNYYYTRLITDAVLAVETARSFDDVDPERLAVTGSSQGGGLALAAAALTGDAVRVCHANVPFLCDFQRAVTITGSYPYQEIVEFLASQTDLIPTALDTLRYVDCALLARRISATSLLSVGLMDDVCPPSTVFAAYHEIPAAKDIAVHPFSGHDVPPPHGERQLAHLREHLI